MNLSNKWMVLRLSAPMQSWGQIGRKSYKPTAQYPSKSGVAGIIANASNIARNDEISIGKIASMEMCIFALSFGTQATDYQTIGCGTDRRQDIPLTTTASILSTKRGKLIGKQKQIVTYRNYLADADFIVICEGKSDSIDKYSEALKYPFRPLFLGRKSYLPSRPILDSVQESSENAIDRVRQIAKEVFPKKDVFNLPFVSDVSNVQDANDFLMDVPICFGSANRGYLRRMVKYGQMITRS